MRTKQLFIIQMMTAAALLSSCSSDDNFTAEGMGNDSQTVADVVPMPILLGVSPNSIEMTRGTGTVGDIEGEATNVWKGEKINVLMLNQGMITPTQFEGAPICVDDTFALPVGSASGAATPVDGKFRYFPATGCSDFWAYRLDDAKDVQLTQTASAWKAIFQIDGSQDIMVAKAVPSVEDLNKLGKNKKSWYYSAYSAHHNVNPNFTFRHLLTRLTFTVTPITDIAVGIQVDSVKVLTYTKGTLTVAATDDVAGEKQAIAWNTSIPRDTVLLKQRASAGSPLVECSPVLLASKDTPQPVVEALLVAPDTEYKVRVCFHQGTQAYYCEETVTQEGNALFEAGTSYNVQIRLKGYGASARVCSQYWDD